MQRLAEVEATSHDAEARLVYAETLRAAGDSGAVAAIRSARDRLLQRAQQMKNPERHSSFLDAVPENRRTLALAAE